jgi:hypothetical protein
MNRIHSANAAMYDTVKSIQISVNKKGKSAMPQGVMAKVRSHPFRPMATAARTK